MADAQTPAPEIGTPEYDAAMAALGESAVQAGNTHRTDPVPEIAPKPENIPDKFYDPATGKVNYDALAKSYAELEKQRGKAPEAVKEPAAKPEGEVKPEGEKKPEGEAKPEGEVDPAAEKIVADAGLKMEDLSAEFASTGALSDTSYEALSKVGIPKETVDSYIAGQQALAAQARDSAFALTNGQENYSAMIGWAAANLDSGEIDGFNTQINSLNAGVRETAIRGLFARFDADTGASEKTLVGGKTIQSGSGTQGYQSTAQMRADMDNPKYRTDPAFREAVAAKVARTTAF